MPKRKNRKKKGEPSPADVAAARAALAEMRALEGRNRRSPWAFDRSDYMIAGTFLVLGLGKLVYNWYYGIEEGAGDKEGSSVNPVHLFSGLFRL